MSWSLLWRLIGKQKGLAGLFSEALDLDETRVRFTVTPSDVATLAHRLEQMIKKYC
ncbi:hypothetical protein GCM10020331_063570 [Ectobacillus funiculus]